jgi:hypothetical protein|tara:strand:+ start:72 stop:278 length:207 start_codon:yes stop_codon:yes gene_type:complete
MNNNYIIAFISQDKDIILEPLSEFNGEIMYFKNVYDARTYINKLYINNGVVDIDPISDEDGLSIVRVQ